MDKIIKIVLKSSSGYGPAELAYSDKLIMTTDGISYEYKPFYENDHNMPRKFNYKSRSIQFEEQFNLCATLAEKTVGREIADLITDIGPTEIQVVYENKKHLKKVFFCPGSYFSELFHAVYKLVPLMEKCPAVLETGDHLPEEVRAGLASAETISENLFSCKALYFSNLKPSDIPDQTAGVYAVYDFEREEVLYVGRTKNLRRRIYTNHLHGPLANARLKKYLIEDPEIMDVCDLETAKQYLKDNCLVKYIVEADTLERGRIEGLLGYLLRVRYIHEEH